MADQEMLEAVCCLVGLETDVTVEEMQLLGDLARGAGLDTTTLRVSIDRARNDAELQAQYRGVVDRDVEGAIRGLIDSAVDAGTLAEGHVTMLLWRAATKLGVEADRFEALLAEAQRAG